jgi:PHD/YefM family antitoxin component YafN of YafNO toxin-antitoxin module
MQPNAFAKLLHTTLNRGEQTIARNGVEVAVFVSCEDWNRLKLQSNKLDGETDHRVNR